MSYVVMSSNNDSLCRICLEDGATLAIFDSDENEESIYNKITKCINIKIENIEGYPRFICGKCNSTLETVCNFIDTYTESAKILESGLLKNVKHEAIEQFDEYDNFDYSDTDVKIKQEPSDKNIVESELESKLVEPLILKIRRESSKAAQVTCKNRSGKSGPKNRTNRIGTSMLEGEFKWDGENWRFNSNKIPILKVPKRERRPKKEKEKVKVKKVNLPKPKSDRTKLCDSCGEIFKDPTKLARHRKKQHESRKAIQCPKCPKKCLSEYYLGRHLKRKHDSKEFICSTCGKQFAFKTELTMHHRRVHEKELHPKKTFPCQFCDKTYKCQKSVTIHERSVHTGDRPAICTVCNASFFHEEYLKEHMRLHTGETPFKCPICGRGYAQSGNMKSHLRNHRVADIEPTVLSKLRPSYLKFLKDNR